MTDDDANEPCDFQLQGFPVQGDDLDLKTRQPVEILASQFVEELRLGLAPSIELYSRRYPLHAETIKDTFPMLALLEQSRLQTEAAAFRKNMPDKFPFRKLGRCELLCELGRGGMGVVFQAREAHSEHIVAVKVLPWRVSIVPEWQKRFEEEARTTAKLRHRNVVPVFRFGQEHGYCYFVMQFVNGVGLDHVIQRLKETDGVIYQDEISRIEMSRPEGFITQEIDMLTQADIDAARQASVRRPKITPESWKSFTQIALQAAQAMGYAHQHGILHNDIKPGNILLDADGQVWITDFGLSHSIEDPDNHTVGRLMGTLRYMAPERLLGSFDARSDIYSLGMTLYELLTLQPAFRAKSEDKMLALILDTVPPPPRSIVKQIPKGLNTIVMNCIAQNPEERYPSARALQSDLLKFSQNQKITSLAKSRLTKLVDQITGQAPPRLRDAFEST